MFAFGIYTPYGYLYLFGSLFVYLSAFAGCVLLIRRAAIRLGWPRAGLVVGLIFLWPMVAFCGESLNLELIADAPRYPTHRNALVVLVTTVVFFDVAALLVELFAPKTSP